MPQNNPVWRDILKPMASLKLTVVLFALSLVLVLAGTLAQIDDNIWVVMKEYFRCFITWIPFRIFFPRDWEIFDRGGFARDWGLLFPGGWLLGAMLLINVLAAHAVRFTTKGQGKRLMVGIALIVLGFVVGAFVVTGQLEQFKPQSDSDADAYWRVLLRLINGFVVALILMAGCYLAFIKRAGIVLIHGGIILMLLSELFTGLYASEGQMRILKGETANYTYNLQSTELAIIDRTDPAQDKVTVIPHTKLAKEGLIQDPLLPFDLQVDKYMVNTGTRGVTRGQVDDPMVILSTDRNNIPRPFLLVEEAHVTGTDASGAVDMPAVRFTVLKKGTKESLGQFLGSVAGNPIRRTISVDGCDYEFSFRLRRDYKPYRITLDDFKHELYLGTTKPKDFSSYITLNDPSRGVTDRTVRIWMNNPLRYEGETFYQASTVEFDKGTVLQVVRNGSWMIPYLSCMIVMVGLCFHFSMTLFGFMAGRTSA